MNNLKCQIATIFNSPEWVKTLARDIDPENEFHLAEEFDKAARTLLKSHKFAGISSNNVYWDLTKMPVRVMMIPFTENKFITVINPEVLKLEGKEFESVEACGSIPDNNNYVVTRKPYILIRGYTLKKSYIELEYGSKDFDAGESMVMAFYHPKAWIIQHELDHLDGITIKDKGTVFDIGSLITLDE